MLNGNLVQDRKFVKLDRHVHRPSVLIFMLSYAGTILTFLGIAALFLESIGLFLTGYWTTLTLQKMFDIGFDYSDFRIQRIIINAVIDKPIDYIGCVVGSVSVFLAILLNWLFEE